MRTYYTYLMAFSSVAAGDGIENLPAHVDYYAQPPKKSDSSIASYSGTEEAPTPPEHAAAAVSLGVTDALWQLKDPEECRVRTCFEFEAALATMVLREAPELAGGCEHPTCLARGDNKCTDYIPREPTPREPAYVWASFTHGDRRKLIGMLGDISKCLALNSDRPEFRRIVKVETSFRDQAVVISAAPPHGKKKAEFQTEFTAALLSVGIGDPANRELFGLPGTSL